MRLHRFYVSELIDGGCIAPILAAQKHIILKSAEFANQVRRVFRLGAGDSLGIFDGSGSDYICKIAESDKKDKDTVVLDVVESVKSRFVPSRDIVLYAALVKKDTFEWIVEKATELGVTHIVPVMAERSEKKSLNEERLRKIAVEASEQSGRGTVPVISPIMDLKAAVEGAAIAPAVKDAPIAPAGEPTGLLSDGSKINEKFVDFKRVAFHTEGSPFDKGEPFWGRFGGKDAAGSTKSSLENGAFALFIGPEGGWSEAEIALFHAQSIPVRCLGNQVLRAETAVVAALSQVVFN